MFENLKKIALVLLPIGMVWILFVNNNNSRRIENLMSEMQSMITVQTNQSNAAQLTIRELSDKIDSLNEEIVRNSSLSFNETLQITDYSRSDLTANTEISFSLKEYSADDSVGVTARGFGGQVFHAAASLTESGIFSTVLDLPIMDDYVLSYEARGSTIRSGELANFNIADDLCDRFKYSFSYGFTSDGNQSAIYSLYLNFAHDTQGEETLKINELYLYVESGGAVVGAVDLAPFLQTQGNIQQIPESGILSEQLKFAAGAEPGRFIAGEVAIAKIVIVDQLGVRYEQADQFPVQNFQNPDRSGFGGSVSGGGSGSEVGVDGGGGAASAAPVGGFAGGGAGGGASASSVIVRGTVSRPRIIKNGEYSWGYISIVETY